MLSDKDIRELKERHGQIHAITVSGVRYVFRTITRTEAISTGALLENPPLDVEDTIVKLAILDPVIEDTGSMDVGTINTLAEAVLEKSALISLEGLNSQLEKAQGRVSVFRQVNQMICAAFPSLDPDYCDKLPIDKLMDLLVDSHEVLEIRGLANMGEVGELSFIPIGEQEATTSDANGLTEDDKRRKADQISRQLEEGYWNAVRQGILPHPDA